VGIENVIGTSFNDTITGDSADNRLEGRGGDDIISGGAGNDMLLGGEGNDIIDGGDGNDTLIAGQGNDTLKGGNGNDTYSFDQDWEQAVIIETADDGVDTLDFSALSWDLYFTLRPEAGSVSSGLSSVSWSGITPEVMLGGSGNDTFAWENGAYLPVTINGGGGKNTLDYSNYGSAITLNLQNSTATGLSGFTGIHSLIGSALADNLIGFNGDTVFTITDVNAGMVNGSFSFTGIENLTGGNGQDRFAFIGNGRLTGSINGGSGSNIMDYHEYTGGAVEISLGSNQATGLGGTFNNIASFIGSSEVDGITGPDTGTLFQVTGVDQIIVNGIHFTGFESLTGGSGNDTFKFNNGTGVTGTIDGGAGRDTIDFSAYTSGVTVDLAAGLIAVQDLEGSISNVEDIIGGQGDDKLTGNDEDNIIIGGGGKDIMRGGPGNDQYIFNADWGIGDEIVDTEGEDTVTFASLTVPLSFNLNEGAWVISDGINTLLHSGYTIERIISGSGNDTFIISGSAKGHLFGGSGDDSFIFIESGSLEGSIDGGSGVNHIDYREYKGGNVIVNLAENKVSSINSSFSFMDVFRFWGSPAVDEIIGEDKDNIFNITGSNAGNVNGLYYFDGFEKLTGGSGNDTFIMGSNAIIGTVAGGSGEDILNYAGYLRAINISISGVDSTGWSGIESGLTGGFSGIDIVQGSSRSDSFTGMNEIATFDLAPDSMVYRVHGFSLQLISLENIFGGNQADTFNINGTLNLNLSGAEGDDTFIFQDKAVLNGSLDGGEGKDRIDWSLYQSAQKAVLTGLGSVDGFNGTLGIIRSAFLNINGLVGSARGDTLTGVNNDAVFNLSTGQYSSGNTLDFSGFAILQGGQGNDTFIISEESDFAGKIDGGAGGIDTLDYSGYKAQVTVDLAKGTGTGINSANEKSISGIEKIIGSITHDNNLKGDNGNNIFVAGSANNILAGGKGNDTYIFLAGWGTTTILENNNEGTDTLDASAIDSKLTFYFENDGHRVVNEDGNTISCDNNVENYMGGSNDDTFRFRDEAVVRGTIDGGQGHDLLSFIDYQSGRSIVLSGLGSQDGFQGRDDSIKNGFDNINEIHGSLYTDSIKGLNGSALWTLETGKVSYAALGRTIELAAVEKLLGGSGADTFSLKDGASHEGSLDGGDGIDLLDYSLYTTAVSVNLSDGSSTGISGSISGFENVTGGSGDDHITGDSKNNVIIGGPGNDTIYGQAGHDTLIGGTGDDVLYGGAGNDTYRFEDNWGSDSIIESDGEGNSILDLATILADLTITIAESGVLIDDASNNSLSHSTLEISAINSGSGMDTFKIEADMNAALYGGDGDDRFVLADGIKYSGLLDGQSGSDTVDFSKYTTGRNILLTDTGAIDGFQGRENSLQTGFTNIDNLLGSMAADTLTGINRDSTFKLSHDYSYSSYGRLLSFEAIETLAGGSGNDRFEIFGDQSFDLLGGVGNDCFVFADQASLNGTLDGQAGSDRLDFSAYTTPRNFILLGTGSSGGFKGSESSLGQFDSINSITGSLATDSITGLDAAATWQVGSNSSYTSGGSSLAMTGIENLLGGAGEDKFVLQKGYELEGLIDGRGGDDTLDYSNYVYGSVINFDLNQGSANAISGGITSIKNVILPEKPGDQPPYSGGGGGGGAPPKPEGQMIYRETGGIIESLGVIVEDQS
jgi:Ca2+-binding RTX toxin-like protein